MSEIGSILRTFLDEYKKTPSKVKALDAFIVYALATAAVQFLYMLMVGTFPFNSFLAGILCSLSFFSLTVCLRMQVDPSNKDFTGISPERAFADYVLANAILFLAVFNYMG
ncbi:MAG: DAD/Ost2 [Monoraphidium minutum]|nr:MAG: DAD/Ost2 [Monoraphidium minutum]